MADIKAAAGRLRKAATQKGCPWEHPVYQNSTSINSPRLQWDGDLWAVYLAEHPADDDEPVTAEWLESVGWEAYPDTGNRMWHSRSATLIMIDLRNPGETWLCHGSSAHGWDYITKSTTRGDVRRLCSALGIQLKEIH